MCQVQAPKNTGGRGYLSLMRTFVTHTYYGHVQKDLQTHFLNSLKISENKKLKIKNEKATGFFFQYKFQEKVETNKKRELILENL